MRPVSEQLSAEVELLGMEEEQAKRFSIVAYTGATVRRAWGSAVFDLAGMSSPERLAILLEHDCRSVVGHADSVSIGPEGVLLEGDVYEDEEAGAAVRRRSLKGFPWKASIGVEVARWEEVEPGQEVEVNGQKLTGPVSIARDSRLFETSFVVNPADKQTSGVAMSHEEPSNMDAEAQTETLEAPAEETLSVREELGEFLKAFPSREGWAALKFAGGLDVTQAKAELCDVLQAELDAERATKADAVDSAEIVAELSAQVGVGFAGEDRQAGRAPTEAEQLAALPEADQADRIWDTRPEVQREFAGRKGAFLACVRRSGVQQFTQEA